ncbi:MAG: hypothetical protein HFF86_10205, partial [Oscillibacter sp.]|nr:hypothetical protein [Oscillibacter sp.]
VEWLYYVIFYINVNFNTPDKFMFLWVKYGLGLRYACLGPFEVCDLGGLDIFNNIASYLFADLCDKKEPFGMLADRAAKGQFGVKNGAGFYDYSDGKDEAKIQYRDEMFTKLAKCLYE